ncbi:MAG: ACT domain-containing protein [Acutalibacteraceae bacterium]|nr:ACT domain-containing protein [Acutalibacteraceae bacterium]
MKAVITVVGKDTVGILAKVSTKCAEFNVNIAEVSQTILQGMFCMIMLGEVDSLNIGFGDFADKMREFGETMNLKISVMHEDIFNSMHKI